MTTENNEIRSRHYRHFLLSSDNLCHLDCGHINVKSSQSMDEIVSIAKNNALTKLLELNLNPLYEETLNKKFHIHNHTLESIRNSNRDEIFYICSHCS